MTLSDVETISLGSYSLGSLPAAVTSTEYATSIIGGHSGSGSGMPVITPTPFASVSSDSEPTGSNTPYGPPSAIPTYVTAGAPRGVSRGGAAAVGLVAAAVVAVLAW